MPSVKDFEKKQKNSEKKTSDASGSAADGAETKKPKRRPGRDSDTETQQASSQDLSDVQVVDVESGETRAADPEAEPVSNFQSSAGDAGTSSSTSTADFDPNRIEIKFKGSELLRAKFPKQFEVAETIATDWMNDGKFEGLPLGHPLAQYFAAKGLQKAKEVEKKVLESPVTEKVAMQALTAGMKAQEIISQVREKLKK